MIDRCVALGADNPILSIHDVGAGGLSNAIPELLHDSGVGGTIDLGKVPSDDPSLSPMQLWCNESQERYVLGVPQARLAEFEALCERERCPFAVVGVATEEERLVVGYLTSPDGRGRSGEAASGEGRSERQAPTSEQATGSLEPSLRMDAATASLAPHPNPRSALRPAPAARALSRTRASGAQDVRPHPEGRGARSVAIDLPMDVLFGKPPKMHRDTQRLPAHRWRELDTTALDLRDAGLRVLAHPTVAAKSFLVTIGDRSIGGLTARDQMVGPWQLPVADCAITLSGFDGDAGEAMAIGERTPLALLDSAAAARMAVGEAITNLCAAPVEALEQVKLSANWMAAASHPGEDARLFDAVHAVGMELCPALDLSIPVGKDSLSMQAQWQAGGQAHKSVSPVSLIVSAFAPVADVRTQLTPLLERDRDSELWLIGLGAGQQRLGGSILAQCFDALGGDPPDLDDPQLLRGFFELIRDARAAGLLRAYHDRSDGGAFAALCEMAFASRLGLEISLDGWGEGRSEDVFRTLFNEELGAVVQVAAEDRVEFADMVARHGLVHCAQRIARPTTMPVVRVFDGEDLLAEWAWENLFDAWWSVTHALQRLRDNPESADAEREAARRFDAPGLQPQLTFDPAEDVAARFYDKPFHIGGARPKVAVLREQGVNGQVEMAAAFERAGFAAFDVHMSDLLAGRVHLADYAGLVACGGFSYGDVLGAGRGWATSVLEHGSLRDEFAAFFARGDRFALGVCNGCQMLSQLKDIVPGAAHWPVFLRNRSEQFEARYGMLEVLDSPSLFFRGMEGSRIPVAIAHGEGRAAFASDTDHVAARTTLRYVEGDGTPAASYPANPNGSQDAVAGLTSDDGRVTILMPHPERTLRSANHSWHPRDWPDQSPWLRMFRNARTWVG